MQLVDRVEKRRFVGREFLLWLWFESEIFETNLGTSKGAYIHQNLFSPSAWMPARVRWASLPYRG